jgi:hypothetical protein
VQNAGLHDLPPFSSQPPVSSDATAVDRPLVSDHDQPGRQGVAAKTRHRIDRDGESGSQSDGDAPCSAGASFKVRKLRQSVSNESAFFDDLDLSSHCPPECVHWVRLVRNSIAPRWDAMLPRLSRPLYFATACTCLGTCIGSAKSLGIPLQRDAWASDVNRSSLEFLAANYPELEHIWNSMSAQSGGVGHCERVGGFTRAKTAGRHNRDILVIGGPCQPWSPNSGQYAGDSRGAETHPLFEATFGWSSRETSSGKGNAIDVCAADLPSVFVFDNLLEFMKPDPITGVVALTVFVARLKAILNRQGDQHFVAFHVFIMKGSPWVDVRRSRTHFRAHMLLHICFHRRKLCISSICYTLACFRIFHFGIISLA